MAVTPGMLAVALGQAAPSELTAKQWQMWIDDAYMLVADRVAKINPAEEPSEAKVDYVVREAVVGHIKKPDDATQVTISVDDGSSSRTYQSSKGRVDVSTWWDFLGLNEPSTGAYAIDMLGTSTVHLAWCSSAFGASFCSCGADIAGRPIYEGADW